MANGLSLACADLQQDLGIALVALEHVREGCDGTPDSDFIAIR